mgnify:CR=1 FL=1
MNYIDIYITAPIKVLYNKSHNYIKNYFYNNDENNVEMKRYYERIEYEGMIATMTATSTSNAYGRIECEVEKRTDPTVTLPTAGQSTNQTSVLSGSGSYPSTTGSHAVGNPTPLTPQDALPGHHRMIRENPFR